MSLVTDLLQHPAYGGDGWIPRQGPLRQDTIWAPFGVGSECGRLRAVLLHRPGPEIAAVADARQVLWLDRLDAARAREQHDALAEVYRAHGVIVHYVEDPVAARPNLYFMKDTFAMTPEGAILARPASQVRAGEERIAAHNLARLGIPIVLSVHGNGTFEGADLLIVNEDLAFVGRGLRTNERGAHQVEQLLGNIGFSAIVRVDLRDGCMHLDCALSIIDRDLALAAPGQLSPVARTALQRHGFRVIELPAQEADRGMAVNVVALEPGVVVMPAANPQTRTLLAAAGVTCIEVDISELMKGGGAIHCITGVIQRDTL